ncbi:MAG TPA: LysE family transporter [Burkholderiales bacterium]|nr:LysE family transporter [Burkholderiales bacterium]
MSELAEIRAFLFGLAVGAAVGPLALYVMHVGLKHGWRKAADCALGVAIADFTYAVIALAFGARLEGWLSAHRGMLAGTGSVLLLALGARLAWTAWTRPPARHDKARYASRAVGFSTTYALTLANPLTILLFLSFAGQLPLTHHWEDVPRYAVFIFLGSLPAQLAYAFLGAGLHLLLQPAAIRAANLASAAAIAGFGIYGLAQAL